MSNKKEMKIDICSACHPFFTGSEKIVDSAGRVEKFKKKYNMK
jgi:large subunit ribosomal protein L31